MSVLEKESIDAASIVPAPVLDSQSVQEGKGYKENNKIGYLAVKRVFDFIASLCASIVILIPMLFISVLIILKDFGNPFYISERVGKDGKALKMLKFRSMKVGADDLENTLTAEKLEEYMREYKIKDDPRLIGYKKEGDGDRCFGAVLRKTSLDELPQILWNICIKGEMSVVGPRPLIKEELEKNYTPEQQRIFTSVKPGLTGYWQAYARNDATYESGKRQKMELHYIQNRTVILDIKIILHTVISVIKKSGAN